MNPGFFKTGCQRAIIQPLPLHFYLNGFSDSDELKATFFLHRSLIGTLAAKSGTSSVPNKRRINRLFSYKNVRRCRTRSSNPISPDNLDDSQRTSALSLMQSIVTAGTRMRQVMKERIENFHFKKTHAGVQRSSHSYPYSTILAVHTHVPFSAV
jgi:hypothetical protein